VTPPAARPSPGLRVLRWLLLLYPAGPRRDYGPQLLQLINDLAQDAAGRGLRGRAAFWAATFTDVFVNALTERSSEVFSMNRSLLIRGCGLACATGGAVFLAGMLTPLHGWLRAGVPASVAGMGAGVAGLYMVLHGRHPAMERLGIALAASGLTLGLIGMTIGDRLGPTSHWGQLLNDGEHFGLVLIGAGMALWGILALRTSAMGRWSFTPVPVGLCGSAGITIVAPDTFRTLENGPLPLLFAAAWILLGTALLAHPGADQDAPTVPA
jgi:hypothetical protein